ncbi:MAG: hypothetical protein CMJ18_02020, partial [Phycisphaeraceae bacterium]|nr:hypothetical protein [Phycisphaeraceae bacterium]
NPPALYGDNAPLLYGTDWPRLMRTTRFSFCEDGNVTRITEDGRLISQHRGYKIARMCGNSCLRFHTPWVFTHEVGPELVALTEAAVVNDGNLSVVKSYASIARPLHPEQKAYIRYFRDHEADYAGVEEVSEVAVYRNFESMLEGSLTYRIGHAPGAAFIVVLSFMRSLLSNRDCFVVAIPHRVDARRCPVTAAR